MATLRALHVQKQVALRKPQDEKKAPPAEAYDAGAMQEVRSEHKTLYLCLVLWHAPTLTPAAGGEADGS